MAEQREKTVSYRRAEWRIDHAASINLGMCISLALAKCKTVAERTVGRGNGQFVSLAAHKQDENTGHYLHLVVDTPGESASVVPADKRDATELKVSTALPPPNTDFMDGDAFIYVHHNDVCLCTTSTTDSTARYFLTELFRKSGIRRDATLFELTKVGNLDKIALLQSQGVREIELRGTIYKASADYTKRKGKPAGLLSRIARDFKAVLDVPHDVNHDALRIGLTFTIDRRFKGIAVGEKRLKDLAEATINDAEDDDEFVIETMLGQKITQTELFMKTVIPIESLGKSVDRDKAWKAVKSFYDQLDNSGALEG
ncbi:MAG: hypothetical protein JWP23_1058 [Phenylobacterium sp.]|nr:hypothetical protein [Phenylobacterium sp.]